MVNGIAILNATADDLPVILALQKLAYQSEAKIYQDYTIPPLLQNTTSLQREFDSGIILKAVVDGRIIGSVRACLKENCCYIGKLIVSPDLQDMGIGKRLMAGIEACYPNAGYYRLSTGVKSTKNIALYEKIGYAIIGQEPVTSNLTLVKMEKQTLIAEK